MYIDISHTPEEALVEDRVKACASARVENYSPNSSLIILSLDNFTWKLDKGIGALFFAVYV